MEIEAIKQEIKDLPLTTSMLAHLRKTARLVSTHYSTYIEGNRLTQEQIDEVINKHQQIPGRIREEKEVLGYYVALEEIEKIAHKKEPITQETIQYLHALIMGAGNKKISPTPYRTVQNIIKEGMSGAIVYLPPEPKDVPELMKNLVNWLTQTQNNLPHPLRAAIAHYQFATIHPYIDGNGRTARILATLILHKNGYDLKGIYSLEEYYAKDLLAYYQALDIGSSHNYYEGRATADITSWIEYFCQGMLESFKKVQSQAHAAQTRGESDISEEYKRLDPRQRAALILFNQHYFITSNDIAQLFNIKPRTARILCQKWVKEGFLKIADSAKKSRKYSLNHAIKMPLNSH